MMWQRTKAAPQKTLNLLCFAQRMLSVQKTLLQRCKRWKQWRFAQIGLQEVAVQIFTLRGWQAKLIKYFQSRLLTDHPGNFPWAGLFQTELLDYSVMWLQLSRQWILWATLRWNWAANSNLHAINAISTYKCLQGSGCKTISNVLLSISPQGSGLH